MRNEATTPGPRPSRAWRGLLPCAIALSMACPQSAQAQSDDEKKALQAKLDQLRNPPSVQPTTPQHVKPQPQPPKPACTCQAGDPLCECW